MRTTAIVDAWERALVAAEVSEALADCAADHGLALSERTAIDMAVRAVAVMAAMGAPRPGLPQTTPYIKETPCDD